MKRLNRRQRILARIVKQSSSKRRPRLAPFTSDSLEWVFDSDYYYGGRIKRIADMMTYPVPGVFCETVFGSGEVK
jgi:hypothetical protein